MEKWQTIKELKRSIIIFSALSIMIVGTIVATVSVYPLYLQLKKNEEKKSS